MKAIGRYCLLVFNVMLIISCNNQQKSDNESANNHISDTLLAKNISFPDNLLQLNGDRFREIDSILIKFENRKKIISIIDGTCMKCIIDQLNYIDSTFNNMIYNNNDLLVFILNVSHQDSSYFMLNLQPAIKARGIILWDNNYNFERQNDLFTEDRNLRTFMTSEDNNIILYGDPTMNPKIIEDYKKHISLPKN